MSRILLHKTKSRNIASTIQKRPAPECSKFMELPPHIVEKILKSNFRDRHEIALACKAFYEASCKIYEDSYWLMLDADEISNENSEKLQLFTKPLKNCRPRVFKNLEINFGTNDENSRNQKVSNQFWNFLEQQGENINKLVIKGEIEIEDLSKMFSYLSRVEDLTFKDLIIVPNDFEILNIQNVENLNQLEIDSCYGFDFKKLKLKSNVLENFNFCATLCKSTIEDDWKVFLVNQKELKFFKINAQYSSALRFTENYPEICNLEKFTFFSPNTVIQLNHVHFEQFVVQQKKLKILELDNNIWDTMFVLITENLTSLEHLSISLKHLLPENFIKIEKLKNLKALKLVDTNLIQIFTRIFKIPVEKLILDSCTITGARAIVNFTKSFPNVKILDVKPSITLRSHFIFEEMFQNMPHLEEATFSNFEGWITPSFKIRSSSAVNKNLKKLIIKFPAAFKWAFFKNFPNLTNLEIFIDNSEHESMKVQMQKIFLDLKNLEKVYITFVSVYRIDFDILKLTSTNPNLKIVQFSNVFIESSAISRNLKKYNKIFGIVEIIGDCKNFNGKIGFTILLAKNEEILMENRSDFDKVMKIYCQEDEKFYHVDSIKVYKKCLNYQNIEEHVNVEDF